MRGERAIPLAAWADRTILPAEELKLSLSQTQKPTAITTATAGKPRPAMNPEKLTPFLYVLMRDHLVPGDIEAIVAEHCEHHWRPGRDGLAQFSNPHLEAYARELADRLAKP